MALARAPQQAAGKPTDKPNLILGSNVQVVWEKFCRYWDVEPRYIPVHEGRYVISPEEAVELIDENTIGVVAILGTTYTGEFEPIEAIHDAVVASNAETGFEVPGARRRGQRWVRRALPAPRRASGTSACRW